MIDPSSKENNNVENPNLCIRPRILLTGLRRSGKTSIQRVIFNKMQPPQTQFLESTPCLTTTQHSCGSFINFQVQELPGQLHAFTSSTAQYNTGTNDGQILSQHDETNYLVGGGYDMERLLKNCHAVVYIIDAQDDYSDSIACLNSIIHVGRSVNPKIRYDVFIHKVDQLSEDGKIETQRDIHNQVGNRFPDCVSGTDAWPTAANPNPPEISITYHLTSIFDHSIFEAFSKVIQKLLPQFKQLEHLLNYLLSASNIEQAFLFDVQTKISIATDSSPTDMQMYELCCDMIDLLLHMSEIYGKPNDYPVQSLPDEQGQEDVVDEDQDEIDQSVTNRENHLDGRDTTNWNSRDEYDQSNSGSIRNGIHSLTEISYSKSNNHNFPYLSSLETTSEPASGVFDSMSSSVIKLTGGRVLYLKEINRHLALICVLREEALAKQAIIDYNVRQLKESFLKLFRVNSQTDEVSETSTNVLR